MSKVRREPAKYSVSCEMIVPNRGGIRVENGLITDEVGSDDGIAVLRASSASRARGLIRRP